MDKYAEKILIVDDEADSLDLLRLNIKKLGYDCIAMQDSREALACAKQNLPDLILLDFMMPGLTGVELCALLKKEKELAHVPVIFSTGVGEISKKAEAFNAGAVDYIIKPINAIELGIRIKNHLSLFQARRELEQYALNMEKLANERARQLVHADRLATLGTFLACVAHEISNPATALGGNICLIESFLPLLGPKTANDKNMNIGKNEGNSDFAVNSMREIIPAMKDDMKRINCMVENLKCFSRKGHQEKKQFNLIDCVNNSIELCSKILKNKLKIQCSFVSQKVFLQGHQQQIEQVLVNLIINAAESVSSEKPVNIEIKVRSEGSNAFISVSDDGPGIAPENMPKIWDPFFTTKSPGKGTGLGLFIVRTIMEEHGGTITVDNNQNGGARFDIILPLINAV